VIVFFALTALLTAFIWVDYYRQIDVFRREKTSLLLLVFLFGGATTLLVTAFDHWWPLQLGFSRDGFTLSAFLYFFFNVGLVEELCKILPLLFLMRFFKKELTEPVDYLVYSGISALGFAAVENTLYFHFYGAELIDNRSILSTLSHVFNSNLVACGFVLNRFYYKAPRVWVVFGFLGLGTLSHALFNFILESLPLLINYLVVITYFFFTISIFSTILNNALNNSPHFSYAKTVHSHRVTNRLISGYLVLFALQFLGNLYQLEDFKFTLLKSSASVISSGFVVVVSAVRLSRFTLIKKRWNPVKLEIPFTFNAHHFLSELTGVRRGSITIKGNAYNDVALTALYKKLFILSPGGKRRTKLQRPHQAFIEDKLFLKNDESCYLVRLFLNKELTEFRWVLLKPKTQGQSFTAKGTPIVALLTVEEEKLTNPAEITAADCGFVEWCLVKPTLTTEKTLAD
jgi:RsiW-degrading membrane proteinase PrsW (M82 family)